MTRVTNEMMANQAVFNLQRRLSRFFELQNVASTGRRINKVSDDPIGAIKDLSYRARLSDITQFKSNISMAQTWLGSTELLLKDIGEFVSQAHELAVAMNNDTNDDLAREAAANEVQSLLDQILEAGNSQLHGRFLLSGYRTDTIPFFATASGVIYQGDEGVMGFNIDTGSKLPINTIGANLLTKPFTILGTDSDLQPGIIGATLLANLNNGAGVDLVTGTFTVKDINRNITVTVDISAATTVADAIAAINSQLTSGGITDLTASLGLEGNNLQLQATANGLITGDTPLANLNAGGGIDTDPGTFGIRNASGSINVTIDITGDQTIGDVLTSINSQLLGAGVSNVTAAINAAGTGIDITDTNGVPLGLYVFEASTNENTATSLGLQGNIDPVLSGAPLNPTPEFVIAESAAGETTAADLGILGGMKMAMVGEDLNPPLLTSTTMAELFSNHGPARGTIEIAQGDSTMTLDLNSPTIVTVQDLIDAVNNSPLTITASINNAGTGIQIVNDDRNRTLMIQNADSLRAASNLGIYGSTDVLGNMMLLTQALHDNDREAVGTLIGFLSSSLDIVLTERAAVGAKVIRTETTLQRLSDYELNYTRLLSEVEDADVTKVVTDLAMQENAYTAALNATAKILQPSLLDFIR